jgi:hypothetical protein
MKDVLEHLSAAVATNFSGKAWQGATLWGSLRGVTPEVALWRPGKDRRCIWDHVLHAAYWKYAARRRLAPHLDAPFPRSPSNWPGRSDGPAARAWRADLAVLKGEHALLMAALGSVEPGTLHRVPPGGRNVTRFALIIGIAAHDAYHTGQIQLLKRLARG